MKETKIQLVFVRIRPIHGRKVSASGKDMPPQGNCTFRLETWRYPSEAWKYEKLYLRPPSQYFLPTKWPIAQDFCSLVGSETISK